MASNNSSVCEYGDPRLEIAVAIRSSFAGVSCLCLLVVFYFIVILEKYKYFTQRLILYLVVASFFHSLTYVMNVTALTANKNRFNMVYCTIMGFCEQITSWWEITAAVCILFTVFMQVVFQRDTNRLEHLYRFLIFFLPILPGCIPFFFNKYGPSGEFCWIRPVNSNDPDCSISSLGQALGYVLYGVPYGLVCFLLVIMLLVAVCSIKYKQKEWKGKYDPEVIKVQKILEAEVKQLIFYPVVLIIIKVFPFIRRLYELKPDVSGANDDAYIVLAILSALSAGIRGTMQTIVFIVVDSDIRKLSSWKKVYYNTFLRCCDRKNKRECHQVTEYPIEQGISDSNSIKDDQTPYMSTNIQ